VIKTFEEDLGFCPVFDALPENWYAFGTILFEGIDKNKIKSSIQT